MFYEDDNISEEKKKTAKQTRMHACMHTYIYKN